MVYGYNDYDSCKTTPPGPDPDDYIRASCDKCGCAICVGERCFVFVDKEDKRTFCDGCVHEFEFEE